jgi:hypothetical protein
MKTIIAGSRGISDPALVARAIKESGFSITEVVSGHAPGVDLLGEEWAEKNQIPVKLFPPDWSRLGAQRAGFIRNNEMARYADAMIGVWDGESSGTADMIQKAKAAGLKVYLLCTNSKLSLAHKVGVPIGKVIYEKSFTHGDSDCEAIVVDLSNDDEIRFWYGICERSRWRGKGTVTFKDEVKEHCPADQKEERQFTWKELIRTARETLSHEMDIATDRFYPDYPAREIY